MKRFWLLVILWPALSVAQTPTPTRTPIVDTVVTVPQGSSFLATLTYTDESGAPVTPTAVTWAVYRKGSSAATSGPTVATGADVFSVIVPGTATESLPSAAVDPVTFLFTWQWPLGTNRRGTKSVEFPVSRIPYVGQVILTPTPSATPG